MMCLFFLNFLCFRSNYFSSLNTLQKVVWYSDGSDAACTLMIAVFIYNDIYTVLQGNFKEYQVPQCFFEFQLYVLSLVEFVYSSNCLFNSNIW